MKDLKINVAIQLLPIITTSNTLDLIDKAIELIKQSKLKHLVCPFETVVEGTYTEIFELIDSIRQTTLNNGCDELIINIKIHASNTDLFFDDKLVKYN